MIFDFLTESNHFILRAHIYQARSLFGSDDTGLSGKQFRPTSILLHLQTAAEVDLLFTIRLQYFLHRPLYNYFVSVSLRNVTLGNEFQSLISTEA